MNDTPNETSSENKPLSRRIRATRTARIFAETRFLRYGLLAKLALVSYALASVILAISAFVLNSVSGDAVQPLVLGSFQIAADEAVSWISLLVAVVLLPVSVLVSAQRFGERALLMRACYVNLMTLEEEAKKEEKRGDAACLENVIRKYGLILALTENHKEVDFQYYKKQKKDGSANGFLLWIHRIMLVFWGVAGVMLPILIVGGVFVSILLS